MLVVVRRSLARLSIPFRQPFATAGGVVAERELALLRLEDDDGTVGYGEAAPFEPYDGVVLDDVVAALRDGRPGDDAPVQARAAWELALLDLEARRGGARARRAGRRDDRRQPHAARRPAARRSAAQAAEGVRAGFSCFKVKVGLPDDVERVRRGARGDRAVAGAADRRERRLERRARRSPRSAGWHATTSSWSSSRARTLPELAELRARLPACRSPPTSRSPPPTTCAPPPRSGACDVVNVKLAASGGFAGAREALRAARAHGLEPFLSSTLDGPWGIAAALQLAASERLSLACGLATLELFDAAHRARAAAAARRAAAPSRRAPA